MHLQVKLTLNRSKERVLLACLQYCIGFKVDQGVGLDGRTPTVSGHAGLARDSGCDDDKVGPLQRLLQAIAFVEVARNYSPGIDVVEIRCDAGYVDEVAKRDLVKKITLEGGPVS